MLRPIIPLDRGKNGNFQGLGPEILNYPFSPSKRLSNQIRKLSNPLLFIPCNDLVIHIITLNMSDYPTKATLNLWSLMLRSSSSSVSRGRSAPATERMFWRRVLLASRMSSMSCRLAPASSRPCRRLSHRDSRTGIQRGFHETFPYYPNIQH